MIPSYNASHNMYMPKTHKERKKIANKINNLGRILSH